MNRIKALFFLLVILIPLSTSAMKIETDEIDEFTGNRTVITSWEDFCNYHIKMRFRLQEGKQRLDFLWYDNDAIVIGEGNHLMFKSTTDNIGKFSATHISSPGETINLYLTPTRSRSTSYTGDMEYFTDNISRLMRIYTVDCYYDKKLSEREGSKLCELYGIFVSALGSEVGSAIASYKLTYLKKGVNDTEWFKDYEIVRRHKSKEDIQKYKDEWESKTDEKTQYKLIVKRLNTDE